MEFTKMNKVNVASYKNYNINQRVTDTIHVISMMKYHKYPSISILKQANVLSEVIKFHDVHLYKVTLYKKCTVTRSTKVQ